MASSARIDELRKKFEENPRRYFAPLANEYRKAGDVEQAISICREYLPQQPGHMSGHIVYGQALYEARQFEEAKTVFETALALDPENLIALRHLGDIALIVGDSDAARSWYKRVLEADPRNEEIQAQLASLDQAAQAGAASGAPTPAIGSPAVPTPVSAASGAAIDASTAATVVVSAVKLPDRPAEPPPIPTMEVEHLPVPELPKVELESPVAGAAPETGQAPSVDSFSLVGLETTSLSGDAPQSPAPQAPAEGAATELQSLSTAPTVELTLPAHPTPAPATPTAEPSEAPRPPAMASTVELLDLNAPTVGAVSPSPVPASAGAPSAEPPAPSAQSSEPPVLELIEADRTASAPSAPPAPPPDLPLLNLGEPVSPPTAPAAAPESGPFVTETMAELYLKQGHRDEALRVYRALLDQRPGDASLEAKIASLTAPKGPTIREVLTLVAMRKPGSRPAQQTNGAAGAAPAGVPPSVPGQEPAHAAPTPKPQFAGDGLSSLFGVAQPSEADEAAARALALAFAGSNGAGRSAPADVPGAPARRASNELSLDSVFGNDASNAAPASSFSFDQFFSRRAATEEMPAPSASGGAGNATSPEEVAHFTKWLEGLKQR